MPTTAHRRSHGPLGVVYLLHFTRPYQHARHYTGFTEDLLPRLDHHARGDGARLMNVISRAGIGFILIRTCEGTRATERAIKRHGGAVRYCPLCTPHPRNGPWGPLPADLIPRQYTPVHRAPRLIALPALSGRQAQP